MRILAIETSCDETALALVEVNRSAGSFRVLDDIVYSQIDAHAAYGGVVPSLASRLHAKKLPPMLTEFLAKNGREIDAVAVTVGPGLSPSLYIGVNQAELLATALGVPMIPVNHMHGHMWSGLLQEDKTGVKPSDDIYPFLAVTVSGGHTELVLVRGYNDYEIVGRTLDDAAGEAYDKVAKLIGLGYPGGPKVAALAEQGDPSAIEFPRPMITSGDGRMSFSGLKTAVLYQVKAMEKLTEQDKANVSRAFQDAVIEVISSKVSWAIAEYGVKSVVFGGGVTANTRLREALQNLANEQGVELTLPGKGLSTDNAMMIGVVAALDVLHGVEGRPAEVNPGLEV